MGILPSVLGASHPTAPSSGREARFQADVACNPSRIFHLSPAGTSRTPPCSTICCFVLPPRLRSPGPAHSRRMPAEPYRDFPMRLWPRILLLAALLAAVALAGSLAAPWLPDGGLW